MSRAGFGILVAIALTVASSGCAMLGDYSPLAPVERGMIFQPLKYPAGNWDPKQLAYEDAWFTAKDGTKLHGWFVEHPEPRAVALFMHGNAGNITPLAESLYLLAERHRLSVMTFDYRGFGRSEGTPSERGILQDARAARSWLAERAGIPEQDVVLMGRSLGGAVAVDLAAKDGARGLVLASTFTSAPEVGKVHYPWVPTNLLMSYRFNSLGKIKDYKGPLLQSHGDADRAIPLEIGRRLFDAAPGAKRFILIPGADHNDPQSEEYREAFEEFIESLPRAPQS
jgi:fermentation-respiration switch protein FrsA (DUF1100 family)